jgi:ADP-ribose pyrophosphatase
LSWETVDREVTYVTPYFEVVRETVRLPTGETIPPYFTYERSDWVIVFCLLDDGTVPLVRHYRHGIKRVVLGLPGGSVNKREAVARAAQRELREETGIRRIRVLQVRPLFFDPTYSPARVHFVFCRAKRWPGGPKPDALEPGSVELWPASQLPDLVDRRQIEGATHIGAIYLGLRETERLSASKAGGAPPGAEGEGGPEAPVGGPEEGTVEGEFREA